MQAIDCLDAFRLLLLAQSSLSSARIFCVRAPNTIGDLPFILLKRVFGGVGDEAPEMEAQIDVRATAETPSEAEALHAKLIPFDTAQGLSVGVYHFQEIGIVNGPIDLTIPLTDSTEIYEVFSTWQVTVCPA